MRFLEIADDLEIDALDLRQVDLLDVDEAQQLAHRLRHLAPAFIARAAALRDADLRPELLLVEAKAAPDFARIEDAVEEFHRVVGLRGCHKVSHWARTRATTARAYTIGIFLTELSTKHRSSDASCQSAVQCSATVRADARLCD